MHLIMRCNIAILRFESTEDTKPGKSDVTPVAGMTGIPEMMLAGGLRSRA